MDIIYITCKNWDVTSKKTYCFSITKTELVNGFMKIIAVSIEYIINHINKILNFKR